MKIRKTAIAALCVVCAFFALSAFASCGLFSPKEADHEHTWDGGVVTVAPGCETEGEITYTCTDPDCGETYKETLPAAGHVAGSAYAYDETGHSMTCAVCGEALESEPHTFDNDGRVTTAPGCETEGVKTYTCEVCGYIYTEPVPALGHNYVAGSTVAPTCTEQGYTEYTCSVCGDSYKADYTDAAGHAWDEGVVTLDPACTEPGEALYTCTVCGETETREVPETGHTLGDGYSSTAEGHSGVCTVCGEELESEPHTFDDGVVTKEATCTDDGETTYTCTVCGWFYTEEIEALGHDYVATVTDPTCTEQGYTTYVCSRCGERYVNDYTDPLGHEYTDVVTKEATCTEDGEILHVCSRCGYSYTETVAAAGHQYVYKFVGGDVHWQECTVCGDTTDVEVHEFDETYISEPDCETAGEVLYVCACGYYYTEEVEALGHSWTLVSSVAAGCDNYGYMEYTCTRCGQFEYRDVVAPLGHTWSGTYYSDEKGHWLVCVVCGVTTEPVAHSMTDVVTTPVTCTSDGLLTHVCAECGYSYDETIAATGHEAMDGSVQNKGGGTHSFACVNCLTWITEDCSDFDEYITKEATCTDDGETTYTCTVCGWFYTEEIEALGHDYVATVTDPTCTEQGYTTYVCSRCGERYVNDYTDPLGHTWDDGVWTEGADCTTPGYTTYTCQVCGATDIVCDENAEHTDPDGNVEYIFYYVDEKTWGYGCVRCKAYLYGFDDASELTLTISADRIISDDDITEDGLAAALESALTYSGVTIILGTNVTLSSAVKVTAIGVTLELGTYTLTLAGETTGLAVTTGTLSVTGGTITSSGTDIKTLISNGNAGTLALDGVTITSAAGSENLTTLIANAGTLTMTDCKLVSDGTALMALITNASTGAAEISDSELDYSGSALTVLIANEGKLTIEGGTLSSEGTALEALITNATSTGDVTIDGTAFSSRVSGVAAVMTTAGTVTIVSADITTHTGLRLEGGDAYLEASTFGAGIVYEVYVTGGTLDLSRDGTIVYLDAVEDTDQVIGFNFEKDINIEITLLASVRLGSTLYVVEGQTVTLNLGKWSMILASGYGDIDVIVNNGTLYIVSTGGAGNQIYSDASNKQPEYVIENYGGLTMTKVYVRTYNDGQTLIYNAADAELEITGGVYEVGETVAIANHGTADISGATIKDRSYTDAVKDEYADVALIETYSGSSTTLTDVEMYAYGCGIEVYGGALDIYGGLYMVNQSHIIEAYGTVTISDATLMDYKYSSSSNTQVEENEDYALIEIRSGEVKLTDVELDAYECGIDMFGGSLEISGGTFSTTFESSVTAGKNMNYYYYVIYVSEGENTITIYDDDEGNGVTFKDGICVAYGATLDLVVYGDLTLNASYDDVEGIGSANDANIPDCRALIESFGTMTISGTGTLAMADYGEALKDGYINADVYYFIRNFGDMTISGEVTISSVYTNSSLITNGWNSEDDFDGDQHIGKEGNDRLDSGEYATLEITGGTFVGGKNTVKNDYDGYLTISGGTFKSVVGSKNSKNAQAVICNQDIAVISGGEFYGENADYTIYNLVDTSNNNLAEFEQGSLTISGGTFTGGTYGVYLEAGELEIAGGEFSAIYPVYAISGTVAVYADAEIYLPSGASLDAIGFYAGTATVTLLGSVKIGTGLYIGEDACVTLELGAYAINLSKAYTDDDAVITNYGTAVVYGGSNSNQLGLSGGTASDNMIRNYGEMTLTGVGLKTGMTGRTLIVNGDEDHTDAALTIEGGKYNAVATIIDNRGTLTMENADLSTSGEGYAIVSSGDVTITGGTITASADGIYVSDGTLTLDGGDPVEVDADPDDDDDEEIITIESALTIGTGKDSYAIYVAGTVEIAIENSVDIAGTVYVAGDARLTLTVEGTLIETAKASAVVNAGEAGISGEGEITLTRSGVDYLIVNYGDMTISSVTVSSPWGTSPTRLIENGWESVKAHDEYFPEPDGDVRPDSLEPTEGYATLTIVDGYFTGGWYVINNDYYGILEIEGGTFTAVQNSISGSANAVIGNRWEAAISGGTFVGTNATYVVYTFGDYASDTVDSVLCISGGEFCGGTGATLYASARGTAYIGGEDTYFGYTDGASIYANWSAVVTVYGGTFEGATATKTENNGQINIEGGTFTAGFSVTSGDYYITTSDTVRISTSCGDAINLYIEADEANVELTGNATLGCTLYVAEEQTLNLDLGEYALTLSSEDGDTAVIENCGTLNVTGGSSTAGLSKAEGGTFIENCDGAVLTIGDGTVLSAGTAIDNVGTDVAITIEGYVSLYGSIVTEAGASATLTVGKDATLLSAGGAAAVINCGDMTIEGAGTITYAADLEEGALTYLVWNKGGMEIDGVTVCSQYTYSKSYLIMNGWETKDAYEADCGDVEPYSSADDGAAALTISGGEFYGGYQTIRNYYGGVLCISGGVFTSTGSMTAVIYNLNYAEISGGTFDGTYANYTVRNNVLSGGYDDSIGQGVMKISGGEFSGGKLYTLYVTGGTVTIEDGTFTANTTDGICVYVSGGTVEISGGTFTGYYGVYLASGDATIDGGDFSNVTCDVYSATSGTLTVSTDDEITIGAEAGATLNLILTGSADITLLTDITMTSSLAIGDAENTAAEVTLDLNGNALTLSSTTDTAVIVNYGTLTVLGGYNESWEGDSQIAYASDGSTNTLIVNYGTMTLTGVYISDSSRAAEQTDSRTLILNGSDSSTDATLTISGSYLEGYEDHIVENYGTLEIENATLLDGNYTDTGNIQKTENESHALIDIYSGTVTLTNVEMDAFECGVEMFGGSLEIYGGTYATPYEMSTNADGTHDYFYYVVYVSDGTNAIEINDYEEMGVTFKDGVCVAYGAELTLTVNGTLSLDDYYPNYSTGDSPSKFPDGRMLIENYGEMTIKGSGSIEMAEYDLEGITNITDADITYLIRNFNVMTIEGAVEISSPYTQSALITNGWYDASQYGTDDHIGRGTVETNDYATEAYLAITGGSFVGGKYVVKNDYAGILEISGGTFTAEEDTLAENNYSGTAYQSATNAVICNLNVATISGGTFNGEGATEGTVYNRVKTSDADYEQGLLTISDGTFYGGDCGLYIDGGAVTVSESASITADIYAAYLKDGDLNLEGGTFTETAYSVYALGGTLTVSSDADIYLASGASLDALTVTKGEVTITLLGSATIGTELYVAEGATVTLDLGTYKLTRSKATSVDGSVVENHGTMVIYGGGTSAQMVISSGTASDNMIRNYGTMYLVSVCLTSSVIGRALIANYSTGELYIYGCTLLADYAYTNEEGGIVGYYGYTSFGDSLIVTDNGDGTVGIDVFSGAALVAAVAYEAGEVEVDITLEADIVLTSDDGTLVIDGGSTVKIDLGGHTLTGAEGSDDTIDLFGTLVITGDGEIDGGKRAINIGMSSDDTAMGDNTSEDTSDASLTIESGTVKAVNDTGDAYAIRNAGGTVVIKDGEISAESSSGDAYGVAVFRNGTLEITGGSISAKTTAEGKEAYGIAGNNKAAGASGTTITVSGGSVYGESAGIYHSQKGELTVSGTAEVSGSTGIEMRNGHLYVYDDAQISSDVELYEHTNDNGWDITGAAVAISDYDNETDTDYHLTVTIEGGTLTATEGGYALFEKVEKNSSSGGKEDSTHVTEITISGGTFKGGISSVNCTGFISGGDFTEVTNCICKYLADDTSATCPFCEDGCDDCTCDDDCECKSN